MPAHTDHPVPVATPAMLDTMRTWRAAHPTATVAAIEGEAMRQVAALRTELIAAALEAAAAAPRCPACGRTMVRNGTHTRTIITSHQERVPLTGHRYRCSACGTGLSPSLRRWTWGRAGIPPGLWRGRCASAPIAPWRRRRRCWRTSPGSP